MYVGEGFLKKNSSKTKVVGSSVGNIGAETKSGNGQQSGWRTKIPCVYCFYINSCSPEVCLTVYDVLQEDHYLSAPSSTAQWQQLGAELEIKWQFPHAVGAIMMESISI